MKKDEKGQLVECSAIKIRLKFNFKKKANMLGINYTVPCLTLVFLVSSPSVTPTPEQKAVWDLLLKRVGK